MKHLTPELLQEYEYQIKQHPDIEGLSHPLINVSDVFRAYFILADYFTDSSSSDAVESMMFGIRDTGLLESALGRQTVSLGGKFKYSTDVEICATLFYGLTKNHPFCDGNKRTALLVLLYQLQLYKRVPTAPKKEFEKLVLAVAENSIPDKYPETYKKFKKKEDPEILTLAFLLSHMSSRSDNTYHVDPTMKEFRNALEAQGVECRLDNGKMHFTRKPRFSLWGTTKGYTIPFGGWTRTVGAKTARETLQKLGLYEQYACYQDLLNGEEPMYNLVDDFSIPLRRLKDK